MKYLAILKDSVREALDSKVLYVLMALSIVVIVVVAGMTYEPQSATLGFVSILHRFPGAASQPFQEPSLSYDVIKLEPERGAKDRPWEGQYRFTLIVNERKPQAWPFHVWLWTIEIPEDESEPQDVELKKRLIELRDRSQKVDLADLAMSLQKEVEQITDNHMERFIRKQLSIYGGFDATTVTRVKEGLSRKNEFRFDIEVQPLASSYAAWPHIWKIFSISTKQETSLGSIVHGIESGLVGTYGAGVAMLISTIITSFFIPNLVRKGTVDLFLTKPIRRPVLLIFKFVGGLTFMFVNTLVIVVGIWLVLGLRSGLWPLGFLWAIFVLTFEFAIFYSVSTLVGVLTQSPIICILAGCVTWLFLWAVGTFYSVAELLRPTQVFPAWVNTSADILHFVTPRYKDLDLLTDKFISHNLVNPENPSRKIVDESFAQVNWGESLGFTAAFIVLVLGLACWRFSVKDY
jgi:ABC-type transport system involved in multi-copper enzyme maturation permease subunit